MKCVIILLIVYICTIFLLFIILLVLYLNTNYTNVPSLKHHEKLLVHQKTLENGKRHYHGTVEIQIMYNLFIVLFFLI